MIDELTFRPSLAWQLTFVDVSKFRSFSSFPARAASSNSSFRYSPDKKTNRMTFFTLQFILPISTGRVEESARSRALFPSLFFRFGSAPCCRRTNFIRKKIEQNYSPSCNDILRQTSTLPLLAASANELKFQLSNALTFE